MAKKERKQKIYNIDAAGEHLGRLASRVATLLRGKTEVTFEPHIDPLITVKISNIEKIVMTGKKTEQNIYRYHTGWPGGLKEKSFAEITSKDKGRALKLAVTRMLKKNRMRKKLLKRLVVA